VLLSKNVKIKMHKTVIVLLVLYRHENWPLKGREDTDLGRGLCSSGTLHSL